MLPASSKNLTFQVVQVVAFETIPGLKRREFDSAFWKNSNIQSIDFHHFIAKRRKLVEKMIHQKKNGITGR